MWRRTRKDKNVDYDVDRSQDNTCLRCGLGWPLVGCCRLRPPGYAHALKSLDRDDDVELDEEGLNPFSVDGGWNGEGS